MEPKEEAFEAEIDKIARKIAFIKVLSYFSQELEKNRPVSAAARGNSCRRESTAVYSAEKEKRAGA